MAKKDTAELAAMRVSCRVCGPSAFREWCSMAEKNDMKEAWDRHEDGRKQPWEAHTLEHTPNPFTYE